MLSLYDFTTNNDNDNYEDGDDDKRGSAYTVHKNWEKENNQTIK